MSVQLTASERRHRAVIRSRRFSPGGLLERLFAEAFRGLVYPQIWEDPEVDMQALALKPGFHMIAIASGGCNVLSYLAANPGSIIAVDLSPAHVALTRLKLAAARLLPSWRDYYRFFGEANDGVNVAAYNVFLRERIDEETRRYFDSRDALGRRRIGMFSRSLYRQGLSGRFIGAGHWLARRYGVDLTRLTACRSLAEQREFFLTRIAPLFDKPLLQWVTSRRATLFGLGIPPAQYRALAGNDGNGMAAVLKARLERLACGFPMAENYFAWQAFARKYAPRGEGALPPYLTEENFPLIRERADRVRVLQHSFTEQLLREPSGRFDAYVLLDAQDWMTDDVLNGLWREITRTARPGARVVFRTAGEETILPGRIDAALLNRWTYREDESRALFKRDRSAAYGGFHLYVFKG
jgi:S-adenosylmethionine-diacylglycerol 3-amino-3-carboxypropyl transferase